MTQGQIDVLNKAQKKETERKNLSFNIEGEEIFASEKNLFKSPNERAAEQKAEQKKKNEKKKAPKIIQPPEEEPEIEEPVDAGESLLDKITVSEKTSDKKNVEQKTPSKKNKQTVTAADAVPATDAPEIKLQNISQELEEKVEKLGRDTLQGLQATVSVANAEPSLGKEDESTQLLAQAEGPCIIDLNAKEKISIDRYPFRLGKDAGYADYKIAGNKTVSRKHAVIEKENNRFYIIDKNSTNGTFVSGCKIPPETRVELLDGKTFSIANEKFLLRKDG